MENFDAEKYVKPHYWFEAEIDNVTYKCLISIHGFSYATLEIKKLFGYKKRKKYFLFGPITDYPMFETITYSHREDGLNPVIDYKPSYAAFYIKNIIKQILKQNPNPSHSYKI
jgi:hypothetical protein